MEDDDTKRFLKDIMYLIARSSRYCYRLSFHEYKHKVSGETLFICFLVIGPVPRHQVAVTRMQNGEMEAEPARLCYYEEEDLC